MNKLRDYQNMYGMLLRKRISESLLEIRIQDLLFLLGFFLYCISNFFDLSVWFYIDDKPDVFFEMFFKLIRYFSYLCCALKLCWDAYYTRKFFAYVVAVIGVLLATMISSGDRRLIFFLIVILAARDVSHDMIIKTFMMINAFLLLITVSAVLCGLLEDYIQDELRQRHYLGFSWTTNGPILCLYISLCYIYLKKGIINSFETLILAALNIWFYVMTDSRFVIIIGMASVIFFGIIRLNLSIKKLTVSCKTLFISVPFWIAIIAILMHLLYDEDDDKWHSLNDLFSNRLALGKNAITEYGFSLFGKPITWVVWKYKQGEVQGYNFVDSSYLNILLVNGFVVLVVVLLIYAKMIQNAYEQGNYYIVWILMFVLVFNMTEPRLVQTSYNPFILLLLARVQGCAEKIPEHPRIKKILSPNGYKCRFVLWS